MIYEKDFYFPDSRELAPTFYEFLEPVRVTVRYPSGTEILVGYGIGEQVCVLESRWQTMCPNYKIRSEIPLIDGSIIIEFPRDMRTRMIYQDSDGSRGPA